MKMKASNSKSPHPLQSSSEEDGFQYWMETMAECPVYHPSKQEFYDPLLYVQTIAPQASKYGVCKIIPPLTCSIPAGVVLTEAGFKFTTEVQPLRVSDSTNHQNKPKFFTSGRKYSIRAFENMADKATARRYQISGTLPWSYLEKEFWREMMLKKKGEVEYGINIDGTAFSCSSNDPLSASKWNLNTFSLQKKNPLRLLQRPIPGVSEPMLYIGMQFSMFAWHVEDHYLYSINYHHCGAPKTWYGVPAYSATQFEKVVRENVYIKNQWVYGDKVGGTFNLLSEKTTMFCPSLLLQHDVPVYRTVQMPGEFVVTFPQAYHAGFSHGFNCGEAVNFAMGDWFPFGAEANALYASLEKMPIIPYQQLLCKEAMLLSSCSKNSASNNNLENPLKVSFTCLVKLHNAALRRFNKLFKKSVSNIVESAEDSKMICCSQCMRECYIAHFVYPCECHDNGEHPICIFHPPHVLHSCIRGKASLKLYVRGDISEMESAARMFEEEEEIQHKVEMQLKSTCVGDPSYFSCYPNLGAKYVPYCEVPNQGEADIRKSKGSPMKKTRHSN